MATQHYTKSTLRKAHLAGMGLNAISLFAPDWAGRMAFGIFCTPRRLPVRERDLAFLQTGTTSFFETDGIRVAVYEWLPESGGKDAPAVLMLHGWESNSARWRMYVPELLQSGYRVLALDAPGHGQSGGREINLPLYSRVVAAFIAQYGAPEAMVGHSLGAAAVVMSMAVYNAPKVHKAVVLGSFAESKRVMNDFFALMGLGRGLQAAVRGEVYKRSGLHIEQYSVVQQAADLRAVKGLVVHDTGDDVSPVAEGAEIAAAWGAKFVQTKGLGHRLQGPAVVNEVVQFLRPN